MGYIYGDIEGPGEPQGEYMEHIMIWKVQMNHKGDECGGFR